MVNKLNSAFKRIKWKTNDLLFSLGLNSISGNRKGKRLLIYHGIIPNARTDINARFISSQQFEQHLIFFKNHFHLVSLEEYFQNNLHPEKLSIAISFDDGYLNNLTTALPLLEKYQIPSSFFITTIRQAQYDYLWADLLDLYRYTGPKQFIFRDTIYTKNKHEYVCSKGSLKQLLKAGDWTIKEELCEFIFHQNAFIMNEKLFPYFKLMEEEGLRQLSKSELVTIGSHGLYHNCLSEISLLEAKKELEISKGYLEQTIQMEVSTLAYPDGSYNRELIDLAEKAGYKKQLAVDYIDALDEHDKRIENRFGINPYVSFNNQMQCIIDEKY